MCTPDVAMPCLCYAWYGCAMPHTFSSLPPHHRLLPRANSCLAMFPNHTSHTTPCLLTVNIPLLHCLATMIPAPEIIHTSDFPRGVITCVSFPCSIAHLTPDALSILSLLAFHHSPQALAIPLSLPHRPYPILTTFLSMACVLKRFPLTSPRKLPLTCVKRGFLRTAEPHCTSQLSPCAPLMSQCHVHAVPGSDVPCPSAIAPSAPPARELLSCPMS